MLVLLEFWFASHPPEVVSVHMFVYLALRRDEWVNLRTLRQTGLIPVVALAMQTKENYQLSHIS